MDQQRIRDMRPIDADAHVVEAGDLYTSRVATSWGDLVPRIAYDEEQGIDVWVAGGSVVGAAGSVAMAGADDSVPGYQARVADIPAAHSDPTLRLKLLDDYGIHAQILYPNLGTIAATEHLVDRTEPKLATECVKAYNDYVIEEWVSVDADRYVGMALLPFWDLDATLQEIARVKELGHKGLIMSIRPETFGTPILDDRYWEPMWARIQDLDLPVNFHIGSAGKRAVLGAPENGAHANHAWRSVLLDLDNIRTVSTLIFSGTCHRFPRLRFVSVESGIGWVPALLESMDWQWQNSGVKLDHPEYDMLPSEYFRRQVYACFWYEEGAANIALDQAGTDNFLYATNFPHPTGMTPAPASIARTPLDYLVETFGEVPDGTLRKVLHDNAAQLYGLAGA